MSAVSVSGLSKSFGHLRVLKDIYLPIEAGGFTVLLGPSGCGKSTLLNVIAGLEDTDAGIIEIDGADVTHLEPSKRGIAMVFQSYALYPTMSVRKNLSFGLRVRSVPRPEVAHRVDWATKLLQIGELLDRKPSQLSGGQRQRVAIGRALVQHAKVFLFDEPLSNLDAKLRTEMRVELKRLHKELGATIIYVTHDQIEAMTLATRIAVMRAGRIEQYATPDDLYEAPATLFVASFVGSPAMNFLRGRLLAGNSPAVQVGRARLPLDGYRFRTPPTAGQEIVVGIRPEHVTLARDEPQERTLDAETLFMEPMGADTLGWFQCGEHRLSARLVPQLARGISGRVCLALLSEHVSLFDPSSEARL
ncbi:MAG: multiple sugar transport system ATP-binding protein [Acetobacteraceae bacterium]|jgi:multiple sugar transport system ATP-binding protein|nr:multiple sugar transport system ATP-binding protein [Acetobacteraceae bacterium]